MEDAQVEVYAACAPIRKRDRVDIMADILMLLAEKAARKTRIMYQINLSTDMLNYYVGELIRIGLVNVVGPYYAISSKGAKFLTHYKEMKGVLSEKIDQKVLGMPWLE